eukprot:COSAG02_NODE_60426_length_271_cov_0.866279_1_plen_53_part_01
MTIPVVLHEQQPRLVAHRSLPSPPQTRPMRLDTSTYEQNAAEVAGEICRKRAR